MNRSIYVLLAVFLCSTPSLTAQDKSEKNKSEQPKKELSPEESSTTTHTIEIQGKAITYDATAATMHLKDADGTPKASVFYVAYAKGGKEKSSDRPITFCFNGGPGSSSIWLHMGVFGPKRAVIEDLAYGQPPYHFVENEFSILDMTDLVFIDPVSTGYSRAAPGEDVKQFHGLEEDVKWVAEFIRQYITRYDRWESPKFLAGESYGTTRAAAMAVYMHEEMYLYLNGIVLLSSVLDFQTLDSFERANDLPFITSFPSLTAAAWYHKKLSPTVFPTLQDALKEAEAFALTDYALALLKGDWLGEAEKKEVIQKITSLTGLTPLFVEQNNLRISSFRFMKELLRLEKRTTGRFDARYLGIDSEICSNFFEYDPSGDAVFGAFTGAFNAYVRQDLNWKKDDEYKVLTNVFPWNYGKDGTNKYLNVAGQLKQVMSRNPACLVFVANGYYDLATPYFAQNYTFKHMNLDPSIKDNIHSEYYEAGHMMYIHPPSLIKLRKDLENYYQKALRYQPPLRA